MLLLYYAFVWPTPDIFSAANAAQWDKWAFLSIWVFALLLCLGGSSLVAVGILGVVDYVGILRMCSELQSMCSGYTRLDTSKKSTVSENFLFVPRDVVLKAKETLPRMQDLRRQGCLQQRSVDLAAAFMGDDVQETLCISHRWESPFLPDTKGEQLRAIQQHLKKATQVKWIWYDFWCLPQKNTDGKDDRSSQDRADFDRMLKSIGDLYLSMRVLILLDLSYVGRFWTLFEAWCAMQTITATGLKTAAEHERRFAIACILNAPSSHEATLIELLATKSLSEARTMLEQPDIVVTNAKDKVQMLGFLGSIEAHVKDLYKLGSSVSAQEKLFAEAKELEDKARKLSAEAAELEV